MPCENNLRLMTKRFENLTCIVQTRQSLLLCTVDRNSHNSLGSNSRQSAPQIRKNTFCQSKITKMEKITISLQTVVVTRLKIRISKTRMSKLRLVLMTSAIVSHPAYLKVQPNSKTTCTTQWIQAACRQASRLIKISE